MEQRSIDNLQCPWLQWVVDNKHIDIGVETVLFADSIGKVTPQQIMVASFWVSVQMESSPGHLVVGYVHLGVDVCRQYATRIDMDVDKSVLELLAVFRLIELQHTVDDDEVLGWEQNGIETSDACLSLHLDSVVDGRSRSVAGEQTVMNRCSGTHFSQGYEAIAP